MCTCCWAVSYYCSCLVKVHYTHVSIQAQPDHKGQLLPQADLTIWGRVTHICVSKLTIIGSDNGLLPSRRQAIIWTNAWILLIRPSGTNFSEILNEIDVFSFKKMHLKMSSAKCRPFYFGLNVLTSQCEAHATACRLLFSFLRHTLSSITTPMLNNHKYGSIKRKIAVTSWMTKLNLLSEIIALVKKSLFIDPMSSTSFRITVILLPEWLSHVLQTVCTYLIKNSMRSERYSI